MNSLLKKNVRESYQGAVELTNVEMILCSGFFLTEKEELYHNCYTHVVQTDLTFLYA